MSGISGTVGLGAMNRRSDVLAVQNLLARAHVSPGLVDGLCGRLTIAAIERYQRGFLRRPDGRVDVDGPTIRKLLAPPSAVAHPHPAAAARSPSYVAPHVPVLPNKPYVAPRMSPPGAAPHAATPPRPAAIHRPANELPHAFWQGHTTLPPPGINSGLSSPTSAQMMALIGHPTGAKCTGATATEQVDPFRATGLRPALAQVHAELPDLYGLLGNNGMRVVRNTRGESTFSNHAWGIAIDFLIGGAAPPLGTDHSSRGLDALSPYFHRAGWYWGGGYSKASRKDPMHFECGLALVRSFGL